MMKTTLTATATTLLLGSTAIAEPIESIVAQFQSYGYSRIEISQDGNLVKIEGVRDNTEREIVFDTASNAILSDETGPLEDDEDDEDDEENDDHEDDEDDDDEEDDDEDDDDEDDDDDDEDDDDDGGDDDGDDGESDDGEDGEDDDD
ncbi:MAG: hypothetical protein QNJ44_02145 [Rhodobacter sp.]|nr:hypothetical protein [Rhodobacter sp.]